MEKTTDKIALAKKLYELAVRGSDGEREAAQAALDKVVKKYGISLDTLDDTRPEQYHFKYHGEDERKLFAQIAYKVIGESGHVYTLKNPDTNRHRKSVIGVECTAAQYIEIELLFDFYKRLYEKEKEDFFCAFVHKHNLFGKSTDESNTATISNEDAAKILAMMSGLSNETPHRQLEE